ncbi:unnamed protein product [Schistosoma turkestanicum]|nr:unnamed protein product [Schistosoma turkestanicum]
MWFYSMKLFNAINSTRLQSFARNDKFIALINYKQFCQTPIQNETNPNLKKTQPPLTYQSSQSFQYSSNIQPLQFKSKLNATNLELKYRNVCQETWRWLDEYWSAYNLSYSKAKMAFLAKEKKKHATGHTQPDMGIFHREFLEANKTQRIQFNLKWYRSIAYIVYLSILVDLQQLWRRLHAKFLSKSKKSNNVNNKDN